MRGHIRRRGERSYEYIVDIGTAAAQRCKLCGRRFWLERKPKECCPRCGGQLVETEERRRAIKGGFATRRECEATLAKVLAAVEAQTFTPPTRVTVKQFLIGEWLPAVNGSLRPTTYSSYAMLTREHILPRLGSLQLQKLTPAAINALYAHLLDEGRVHGAGGLSASSVRRVHAVLHKACRDAVRWGRLSVNPVDGADPPRANADQQDKLRVWNAEQLSAFLAQVADDRLYALWRLLAMTGMRRGEALGVSWQDVDMEGGSVTIRRAWIPVDGVARFSEPKSRSSRRTIALDPATLEVLQAHAARQADEQTGWQECLAEAGLLFTRPDGRPLVPWTVSKAFREHARAAMLPAIPLHGLRHTYATLALASGINPRIVSARLGHATVALTLDVYSHVLPQADREAAERIAALLPLL
jgi:integrase